MKQSYQRLHRAAAKSPGATQLKTRYNLERLFLLSSLVFNIPYVERERGGDGGVHQRGLLTVSALMVCISKD